MILVVLEDPRHTYNIEILFLVRFGCVRPSLLGPAHQGIDISLFPQMHVKTVQSLIVGGYVFELGHCPILISLRPNPNSIGSLLRGVFGEQPGNI